MSAAQVRPTGARARCAAVLLTASFLFACADSRLAPSTAAACPAGLDTTYAIATPGYALVGAHPQLTIAGSNGPDSRATRCAAWATSNTAVLQVDARGTGSAKAAGLVLVSAQLGRSVLSRSFLVLSGFDVVDLSLTLGDSVVPVALGNGGQLVGYHGVPARPFFWRGGSVTELACNPLDVNALDVVLCNGNTLWDHGRYLHVTQPNDSATYFLNTIADNGMLAGRKSYSGLPSCIFASAGCACGFYAVCVVSGRPGALRTVEVDNRNVRSAHGPFINSRGDVLLSLDGHGANFAIKFDSLGVPITDHCDAFFQFDPVLGIDDARDVATRQGFCGPGRFIPYGPSQTTAGKDMSSGGRVVGSIGAFNDPNPVGFLWTSGFTVPLDSLLPGQPWKILSGNRVNTAGQIEATGRDQTSGRVVPLLLTPRP